MIITSPPHVVGPFVGSGEFFVAPFSQFGMQISVSAYEQILI